MVRSFLCDLWPAIAAVVGSKDISQPSISRTANGAADQIYAGMSMLLDDSPASFDKATGNVARLI